MAEVIQTISTSDGGADFATVQAAWDALPADLVVAGDNHIFEFITENDVFEPGSGTAVLFAQGVTTGVGNDVVFRRASGINKISFKGTNTTYCVEIAPLSAVVQDFVTIDGIDLIDGGTWDVLMGTVNNINIINCLFQGPRAFYFGHNTTISDVLVRNCIITTESWMTSGTGDKVDCIFEKNYIRSSTGFNPSGDLVGCIFRQNFLEASDTWDWDRFTSGSIIENSVLVCERVVSQTCFELPENCDDITFQHNYITHDFPFLINNGAGLCNFFNNIFMAQQSGMAYNFNDTADESGFLSDGNMFINTRDRGGANSLFQIGDNTIFTTLAAWQAATVNAVNPDQNSSELTEIPENTIISLIRNSFYYRGRETNIPFPNIDSDSDLYQAGIDRPTTVDFYGVARNDTTPSIGPVEEPVVAAGGGGGNIGVIGVGLGGVALGC